MVTESVPIAAGARSFRDIVVNWLNNHTSEPFYFNSEADWNVVEVSFYSKNDMLKCKIYFDGLKVIEERNLIREIE